ncbi:MAG TPA: bifunctional nuclease family protein [Acidimicrobiales bacterium]|nr:bifunctional nuclease family protein [Acidimicrobiales bacterium]
MTPRPQKTTSRPATTPAKKRAAPKVARRPGAVTPPIAAVEDDGASPVQDSYRPVRVVDVVMVLPNPNPTLVLEEVDEPYRRISIPIGVAEGTSIAYALRGISTPKPLVHDLFASTLSRLDASVVVARVTSSAGGAYYAEIVVNGLNGQHEIACRPSDAVALAVRQRPPTPIVVASSILEREGGVASGS